MVVRLRVSAPDWHKGKCYGIIASSDYDPFFDDQPEAVVYCNGDYDGQVCPIREECLLYALTNNEREGVWGGMSELGRRALRKRWPLENRKRPRPEWRWMPEAEAIHGVRPADLVERDDDEQAR